MVITGIVLVFFSLMAMMASIENLFEVNAQIQSPTTSPNLAQGQTTQPTQQATTSPSQTQAQQTQEPTINPFTIPTDNQVEDTGTANSSIRSFGNSNGKQTNNDIILLSQRFISDGLAIELLERF